MFVFIYYGSGWVEVFFLVRVPVEAWFLDFVLIFVGFLSEMLIMPRYSSNLLNSSVYSLIGVTKSWDRLKGSCNLSMDIKSKGCLILEDNYEFCDLGYVLLGELNSLYKSWSKLI